MIRTMKQAVAKHRVRRQYRQTARAAAAEMTALRIAEAFLACISNRWFDEVTLEEVAERAGVTVRTVMRRFGSKEGLACDFVNYISPQIFATRQSQPGDVSGTIAVVIASWEEIGDGYFRILAQEQRQPALRNSLDAGRRGHRQCTAEAFAPWLDALQGDERRRLLDALVIATDVYVWKQLRRDMGLSVKATKAAMLNLVTAILGQSSLPATRQGANNVRHRQRASGSRKNVAAVNASLSSRRS